MKINITPVPAFRAPVVAIDVQLVNDDLKTRATLYWAASREDNTVAEQGNLFLTGDDYTNWDGSNEAAIDYALTKLGLTRAPEAPAS